MRHDEKDKALQLREQVDAQLGEGRDEGHLVFDFTGLQQLDVGDLALILTARLGTSPAEKVWVRSIPSRTAEVLRILRLDHLFLTYPEDDGQPN